MFLGAEGHTGNLVSPLSEKFGSGHCGSEFSVVLREGSKVSEQ